MSTAKKKSVKAAPSMKPFQASEALFNELLRLGKTETASPGTILFSQGQPTDGVFLVLNGRVALSAGDDPVRITRIAGRASILGLPATVRDQPYSLTAEAVVLTQLCHIPAAPFRTFLQQNPTLCFEVLQIVAAELSALRDIAVYQA